MPRKRVIKAAKKRFRRLAEMWREGLAGYREIRGAVASFIGYMSHCSGRISGDSAVALLAAGR